MFITKITRQLHKCTSLMRHPHYCKLFCPLCYEEAQEMLEQGVNYFKLYLQEETYYIDKQDLSKKYRSYQNILHPDKLRAFNIDNPNYSKFLVTAYETLKCDLERGRYLLKLNGVDHEVEYEDIDFLEKQVELRAQIYEDPEAASEITNKAIQESKDLYNLVGQAIHNHDWDNAKMLLYKMSFVKTLISEANINLSV